MGKTVSCIKSEQKGIVSIVTARFKNYYLTGGTALGMYFNHRFSEDLDFFTQKYRKEEPDKIMKFISAKTSYVFKLEAEQDAPGLVPMKVYSIELKQGNILRIDFVQDFMKNIKRVKNGLHSIEDIYLRKVSIAAGSGEESVTGRLISVGRQTAKDLYDIFYLSQDHMPVASFFLEHFSADKAENLIAWYRSFNRMNLRMELLDLVPKADTAKILKHLDGEILKELPRKLILQG